MPHTIRVGEVEILSLLDVTDWTLSGFFPSVPPDVWEAYRAIYPDALRAAGDIFTSATAYAVRAAGQTVLVDTGLGPGPHERIGNQAGQLLNELRAAGLAPEDIDIVVFTHLHGDHVGWNAVTDAGVTRATFTRARYLLPQKDWEYYREPARRARAPHLDPTGVLFDQGRLELVDGEQAVTPHVSLLPTPGHTPGHQAIMVTSQGEHAAIIGDLAHTPPQVQELDWMPRADVDPELATASRRRLLDRIEADHTLLCAGHFPHPGFGYLARIAGRRVFQAVQPGGR